MDVHNTVIFTLFNSKQSNNLSAQHYFIVLQSYLHPRVLTVR